MGHDLHPDPELGDARGLRGSPRLRPGRPQPFWLLLHVQGSTAHPHAPLSDSMVRTTSSPIAYNLQVPADDFPRSPLPPEPHPTGGSRPQYLLAPYKQEVARSSPAPPISAIPLAGLAREVNWEGADLLQLRWRAVGSVPLLRVLRLPAGDDGAHQGLA